MALGRGGTGAAAADSTPSPGSSQPVIVEDGYTRCLHFGPDYVQSRMIIDKPDELHFAYTRKMMAFLLFCPRPKHVVIIGLGGGSLTKFCYRHLPQTRITTVEISQEVIGISRMFGVPEPDDRMRILHADAVDYFDSTTDRPDVILLDGCDEHGVAPAFCNERFYQQVRARLRHRGVLVANLVGTPEIKDAHATLIAGAFGDRVVVLPLTSEANRVAFAFNDPWTPPDWTAIERRAKQLARQYELDFPAFARKLQRQFMDQEANGS